MNGTKRIRKADTPREIENRSLSVKTWPCCQIHTLLTYFLCGNDVEKIVLFWRETVPMFVNLQTDIVFMSSHGKQHPLIATDHRLGFPLVSLCVITGDPLYASVYDLSISHATNADRKKKNRHSLSLSLPSCCSTSSVQVEMTSACHRRQRGVF